MFVPFALTPPILRFSCPADDLDADDRPTSQMGLFPRRRDSSQDRQLTSYSVTDTAHNLDSMLKEDRVGFQWLQRAKVPLLVW